MIWGHRGRLAGVLALGALVLAGCAAKSGRSELPPASFVAINEGPGEDYVIGPLDSLSIFVWRNPDLSVKTQVRLICPRTLSTGPNRDLFHPWQIGSGRNWPAPSARWSQNRCCLTQVGSIQRL